MKNQVISDIRQKITRQDMLEIVAWFYLTMTGQVRVRNGKATIIFNKVAPIERDVIYNFIGVILDQRQIQASTLGILESLVASELSDSALFVEMLHEEIDPRKAASNKTINLSQNLLELT